MDFHIGLSDRGPPQPCFRLLISFHGCNRQNFHLITSNHHTSLNSPCKTHLRRIPPQTAPTSHIPPQTRTTRIPPHKGKFALLDLSFILHLTNVWHVIRWCALVVVCRHCVAFIVLMYLNTRVRDQGTCSIAFWYVSVLGVWYGANYISGHFGTHSYIGKPRQRWNI